MNNDETLKYRRKVLKIGFCIFLTAYFIATWYATQNVAQECNYHPVLGKYITAFGTNLYFPLDYLFWKHDENMMQAIPNVIAANEKWGKGAILLAILLTYGITKNMKPNDSHGSASWATKEDIVKSDLGSFETKNGGVFPEKKHKILGLTIKTKDKQPKKSGVVVGINPYTHKLMLHNGPEHMLLMAPTRSGKGVNTIIPTGLIWQNSIFFFDPKGELWANTSGYRQKFFHQKVMKFQPLCTDGSGARWNPLAEVNFRTNEEWPDVTGIVSVMVKPDGEKKGGGDPFWDNSAASLLNGVIVHLLYQYYKEGRPLPCPSDIMSFLSSPSIEKTFKFMQTYPHISEKEFMEETIKKEDFKDEKEMKEALEGKSVLYDEKGNPIRYKNILKEIYGEYIKDFRPFQKALGKENIKSVEDIRQAILAARAEGKEIDFEENVVISQDDDDDDDYGDDDSEPRDMDSEDKPWFRLLTHPKVVECASNMLNGAEQTRASILQTAQSDLGIYQNPVVQKNTCVSDFAIRDLLDPNQEVSLYLVMEVKDVAMVKPLARLFINTLLNKLIRDMKFSTDPNAPKPKKQRLLLMLDEFPQLGNMESIELALAICAGYGIKMCIVCQDVNQLNKAYTKDNSIASNCHVHIYFTPNLDSGGATAEAISKNLGKKTINTVSHSDGGGGFFKGSDSTSQTGRELMTPDEVSHLSSEKEIVFVAGHKAILGDKLRYYLNPGLVKRTTFGCPPISDTCTKVYNYDTLFEVHRLDQEAEEEKERTVIAAKAKQHHITLDQYKGIMETSTRHNMTVDEYFQTEDKLPKGMTMKDYFKKKEEEQHAKDAQAEHESAKEDEKKPERHSDDERAKDPRHQGPWGQSPRQMMAERERFQRPGMHSPFTEHERPSSARWQRPTRPNAPNLRKETPLPSSLRKPEPKQEASESVSKAFDSLDDTFNEVMGKLPVPASKNEPKQEELPDPAETEEEETDIPDDAPTADELLDELEEADEALEASEEETQEEEAHSNMGLTPTSLRKRFRPHNEEQEAS